MSADHRRIARLIREEEQGITDLEFFTSNQLKEHLEDIAAAQTRRYSRRVRVSLTFGTSYLAMTDNLRIYINVNHPLICAMSSRVEKYQLVLGLFTHELGHALYTDFMATDKYGQSMSRGKWYPKRPAGCADVKEIEEWLDREGKWRAFCELGLELNNILEDGRIEERLLVKYPGTLGKVLRVLRQVHWEQMVGVPEQKARFTFLNFESLTLQYAKYGHLKGGGKGNPHAEAFDAYLPDIDEGLNAVEAETVYDAVNRLLVKAWPLLRPVLERGEILPSIPGRTEPGRGETRPVEKNTRGIRAARENMEENNGQADRASGQPGGTGLGGEEKAVSQLAEQMAERRVMDTLDRETCEELNALARRLNYGPAHDGVKVIVKRESSVTPYIMDVYNNFAAPLEALAKRLAARAAAVLEDKRNGGKRRGLLLGKDLDYKRLYDQTGHVFYKKDLPGGPVDLVIGLLLDESGSMQLYNRCEMARKAAVMLYAFCRRLSIPICVMGHTADTEGKVNVELFSYVDFDDLDGQDRYRLMDTRPREDNRDGLALRYMVERLTQRPERNRLLFIVSDGMPCAAGYWGQPAEKDIQEAQKMYRRQGVHILAAAIGDDRENIERIYGAGAFLDISDMNNLPQTLIKHILRCLAV